MRIIKHSSQTFPTVATGSLVGMDVNGQLQITNSFPFPSSADSSSTDGHDGQNAAAAAPRSKANHAYQAEMVKFLREVNVDAQNAGWYLSANMGNFVNMNTIENQYFYQKELNERTVTLVHDVSRSSQGSLSLRAFRLSPQFVTAYKEAKFTTERYASCAKNRVQRGAPKGQPLTKSQPAEERTPLPGHFHRAARFHLQLAPVDLFPPPTPIRPSQDRAHLPSKPRCSRPRPATHLGSSCPQPRISRSLYRPLPREDLRPSSGQHRKPPHRAQQLPVLPAISCTRAG